MKDLVAIYKETGDFQETVLRSGLSPLIVHIRLAKCGVLKIQDKIKYGTRAIALGGKAEELFQKLVPDAVDANRMWKKNNPGYDFLYRGLSIDIKYSSLQKRGNAKYWNFRTTGKKDMFVVFLEREEGEELKNPYILLIPKCFMSVKSNLHISTSGNWFTEFKVEKEDLKEYLEEYAGFKEV